MPQRAIRVTVLAALLIVAGGVAAWAERFTERQRETHALGSGAEIALSNTNGRVTVTIWDRADVELVAEKRVEARSAERARDAFDEIEIVVHETTDGLEIETRTPTMMSGFLDWLTGGARNAAVSYELRVPADARLRLSTVNGNLSTDGAGGGQWLRSTNGRIDVVGARRDVDAHTVNGSIDVEIAASRAAVDVRLASTNGGITLALPGDLEARLDARTVNGSVRSDLPVAISGRASRRRISGDLNGGGAGHVEMSTTNGGIRIRAAGH
jgi:DUF4097 and DUF4098 domain-containing protein YvlB